MSESCRCRSLALDSAAIGGGGSPAMFRLVRSIVDARGGNGAPIAEGNSDDSGGNDESDDNADSELINDRCVCIGLVLVVLLVLVLLLEATSVSDVEEPALDAFEDNGLPSDGVEVDEKRRF